MKKSRFTESQIIAVLKEADAAVIKAINDVLKKSPQAGFWACFGRLRFQKYGFCA